MPNANYVKGRRKEYYICNKLKEEGFDIAQRTAGSHSPFDIIAVRKRDRQIKLVQAKPSTMPDKQIIKILEGHGWLDGTYEVKFEVR